MTGRKILAFYSPYPGAGKSSARNAFDRRSVFGISFAEPVRALVYKALNPFLPNTYNKDESLEGLPVPVSFRDFMIAFGQAGRSVWPDIWIERARERINLFRRSHYVQAIIDDLRFPNEYAMLREEGAKIVRLTVPGREIVPSETEALLEGNEFDAELENTMDGLDIFRVKVWKLVEGLWA